MKEDFLLPRQSLTNRMSWAFDCSAPFGPVYLANHTESYYGKKCHIGTTLQGTKAKVRRIIQDHNAEYHR